MVLMYMLCSVGTCVLHRLLLEKRWPPSLANAEPHHSYVQHINIFSKTLNVTFPSVLTPYVCVFLNREGVPLSSFFCFMQMHKQI
jgi:hypothetical protein